MPTISFFTFGCKLNQAETIVLKEKFYVQGFSIVPFNSQADFYLINACAVTQKAEKEVRQAIHQIKRQHPNSQLIVAGCLTKQIIKSEQAQVDLWIENKDKKNIYQLVLKNLIQSSSRFKSTDSELEKDNQRTRALIKIQDGCQHYCTYCIVPYLRQKIYSQPLNKIIQEIKEKEKQGFHEVVLVGANISLYNDQGLNLSSLLEKILDQTKISRLRISSLWPTAIDQELLSLIKKNSRLCSHLHLSIQSACDKILLSMGRNYKQKQLKQIIAKLDKIPNLSLTADIIVGFPGQKESNFQETYQFIKWAKFLKIHVFRFSPRPGTKAYLLKNQVPDQVKQTRAKILRNLSEQIAEEKRKKYFTQILPVLFESKQGSYWSGLTPNYLKVFIKTNKDLSNKIINLKLTGLYQDGLKGKIFI